jgi:sec-independent protein translocase protein TatB
MFNVTGGELFMILVVALVVLGPERLPTAARRIGEMVGQLRDLSDNFKREVAQAMDDPNEPIVKPMTRPRLTALDGGASEPAAPASPPASPVSQSASPVSQAASPASQAASPVSQPASAVEPGADPGGEPSPSSGAVPVSWYVAPSFDEVPPDVAPARPTVDPSGAVRMTWPDTDAAAPAVDAADLGGGVEAADLGGGVEAALEAEAGVDAEAGADRDRDPSRPAGAPRTEAGGGWVTT